MSWTELRRALATRAGVSEKEANAFLSAFQTQLVEALKQDKQVKVNGLGTFKLQAVAPRKSVNVATGEEIIIEGYNKLAFTPEAGVKELIESQETGVQTSEVDPIQKLGAQAEEIVDILGDLGQGVKAKEEAKGEGLETKEEAKGEGLEEKEEAKGEGLEANVAPEPEPVAAPEPEYVYKPEPVYIPEPEPEIIVQRPKEKKKSHFWRNFLIFLILLLAILAACYFFFRQQLCDFINSYTLPFKTEVVVADTVANIEEPIAEEAVAEEAVEEEDPETAMIPDGAIPKQQILEEWKTASGEMQQGNEGVKGVENAKSDKNAKGNEGVKGTQAYKLITTEAMHEGSRLTWMSYRFYGNKAYWPYIYDANRDRIDNPNMIETGTPIRVPKLSAAQRDTTSAAFLRLKAEAEAACR